MTTLEVAVLAEEKIKANTYFNNLSKSVNFFSFTKSQICGQWHLACVYWILCNIKFQSRYNKQRNYCICSLLFLYSRRSSNTALRGWSVYYFFNFFCTISNASTIEQWIGNFLDIFWKMIKTIKDSMIHFRSSTKLNSLVPINLTLMLKHLVMFETTKGT